MASSGPTQSIAVTLAVLLATVGYASFLPIVICLIPMLGIAIGYQRLNAWQPQRRRHLLLGRPGPQPARRVLRRLDHADVLLRRHDQPDRPARHLHADLLQQLGRQQRLRGRRGRQRVRHPRPGRRGARDPAVGPVLVGLGHLRVRPAGRLLHRRHRRHLRPQPAPHRAHLQLLVHHQRRGRVQRAGLRAACWPSSCTRAGTPPPTSARRPRASRPAGPGWPAC